MDFPNLPDLPSVSLVTTTPAPARQQQQQGEQHDEQQGEQQGEQQAGDQQQQQGTQLHGSASLSSSTGGASESVPLSPVRTNAAPPTLTTSTHSEENAAEVEGQETHTVGGDSEGGVPYMQASSPSPPASLRPSTSNPQAVSPFTSTGARTNTKEAPFFWFWQHPSGAWSPFSKVDSDALEEALQRINEERKREGNDPEVGAAEDTAASSSDSLVETDGGRYEVNVVARARSPRYWKGHPDPVVRSAWIVGQGPTLRPLPEEHSDIVELAYVESMGSAVWKKRVDLPNGDHVVLHHQNLFVFYAASESEEPRRLSRGLAENVAPGESPSLGFDHLVLVLCGPTPETPNLKRLGFSVESSKTGDATDICDALRSISSEQITAHFMLTGASKSTGRVEFLPVHWAAQKQLLQCAKGVQLDTIRNLREFVNEILADTYAYHNHRDAMIAAVAAAINSTVETFRAHNPSFHGSVSVVAHGFGGILIHDLLSPFNSEASPSPPKEEAPDESAKDPASRFSAFLAKHGLSAVEENLTAQDVDLSVLRTCNPEDLKQLSLSFGMTKRISKAVEELKAAPEENSSDVNTAAHEEEEGAKQGPRLTCDLSNVFLIGCPLATHLAMTTGERPGLHLPAGNTRWFNMFHPYDPLACRLDRVLKTTAAGRDAVEIPHHKGRGKRMHLEFKDYLKDTKRELQREVSTWAGTAWSTFNNALKTRVGVDVGTFGLKRFTGQDAGGDGQAQHQQQQQEEEQQQQQQQQEEEEQARMPQTSGAASSQLDAAEEGQHIPVDAIDFVLQASPTDVVSQAVFAMKSHRSYWTSEDTVLFVLTKLYTGDH